MPPKVAKKVADDDAGDTETKRTRPVREVKETKKEPEAPKKEASKPKKESAKPQKEVSKPTKETAKASKETVKPSKEASKSKKEPEAPKKEAAKPKKEAGKPQKEASKPVKETGKAKKETKASKKDPNAPKKARSAYIIFSTEEGKKVREANPEMSAPDVLKELGRRWGALDAAKKATYEKRAADDKERYKEEMDTYSPPPSPEPAADSKKGGKRAKKDPNAPKRAMTSYLLFSQVEGKKVRESNPGMSVGDVMKEVAARWSKLDAGDKEPYEKKAAEDKQRYNDQLAAYREGV